MWIFTKCSDIFLDFSKNCRIIFRFRTLEFAREGSTLYKNFMEQKTLKISQRIPINFCKIFWDVFEFLDFAIFWKNPKMCQKILWKFTRIFWLILSTFCYIKFVLRVDPLPVKKEKLYFFIIHKYILQIYLQLCHIYTMK